jgi:hypothetical protein
MQVDHITVAGPDLDTLRRRFAAAGLETDYGGAHSNGVTHMALLGFEDGSYVELISTLVPGTPAPWWPKQISADGGLCAWCARTEDIEDETRRLRLLGVPVRGPVPYHRVRPDGTRLEWDLAFIGDGEPGSLLPFLIQDRTPREWRVQRSAGVAGTELAGIAGVVIGVQDLTGAIAVVRRVYRRDKFETHIDPQFGATIVTVTGAPLTLAAPLAHDSWLARRLAEYGDSPAALLLRSTELSRSARRFPACRAGSWLGSPALWFDPEKLGGVRLGITEEAS